MVQQSAPLKAIGDASLPLESVVVNPNDGYDLGLMNTAHPVKLHGTAYNPDGTTENGYLLSGRLIQENNCTLGTVVFSTRLYTRLGKPALVRLNRDDANLTIQTVS